MKKKEKMSYLIAQTSGKQFVFKPGEWYDIDFVKNGTTGNFLSLNKILLLKKNNQFQLGEPFLKDSQIFGKIIQQVKGKKITVLKTKPKKFFYVNLSDNRNFSRI